MKYYPVEQKELLPGKHVPIKSCVDYEDLFVYLFFGNI